MGMSLAVAQPQRLHFDVPEGSWRVTATLGGRAEASDTTINAELRRLMVQSVRTAAGQTQQVQFTVHVRRPEFPGGRVALREPRESVDEALNWDSRLTLEITGARPALKDLFVAPVQVPLLFVLGDSTVADQAAEPYASWGQMLPRFVGPDAAVANLAQSGETYRDSLERRRLDKILSLARPGDTVLMQYGHNDQKQLRDGSGSVASYQQEIRRHVQALRERQLLPVIVTSVERRFFDARGKLQHTLADHVAAARAVASEMAVPLLDLNTASRTLYEALGPAGAEQLFARGADGKIDPTHHNSRGAWLLAGLVAQGLRDLRLPAAAWLRDDGPRVDAAHPPLDTFSDTLPAGWSVERLARLDRAVNDEIVAGRLAGAVLFLAQGGRRVHVRALGFADRENRVPMREDTLFRIASMSKAVTTVAALMLYEEGRFLLRDPIAKWLPAFADMRVAVPTADGVRNDKARRPITVRDLLLHTAGLTYGDGPAAEAWRAAGFTGWYLTGRDETLGQWTGRLAQLPLQGHPGEAFQYGYATDVLGRLVELWSGQSLEHFVAERITGPLRMVDTHFFVPPEKAARLANVYALRNGKLEPTETAATSHFVHGPRKLASGGAGLVSTAADYGRFLQMLASGGTLDGMRLLSPATVAMMTRDHLGHRYSGDGEGFGLGFWVQTRPGVGSELGVEGSYGWGSAYFPQYFVNPRDGIVFMHLSQLLPSGDSTLTHRLKVLAHQAYAP